MNVGYVHTLETPDNAVDRGTLRVSVIDRDTNQPVQNARVEVSYTADPESVLEVLDTDNSGLTEDVGRFRPQCLDKFIGVFIRLHINNLRGKPSFF